MTLGLQGLGGLTARSVCVGTINSLMSGVDPHGVGPLVKDANGIIDLPDGFSYSIVSRLGHVMGDGFVVPGQPDGMAAFEGPDGLTLIVCNHENELHWLDRSPFGPDNALLARVPKQMMYDSGYGLTPALGGTTTLVYNTRTQTLVDQFMSLAGTSRNCAGGPTPWGSWITCEETVETRDDKREADHGYPFEVPARVRDGEFGLTKPVPLRAMGRFNHEAVAVNPASGVVYQTEDRHDGLLYRFIPNVPERLAQGGRLQALAIVGRDGADLRNWDETPSVRVGDMPMLVRWIDLDGVDSPDDDLRYRGYAKGCARFARGEGMWFGDSCVYFVCTSGGEKQAGQIWKYTPAPAEIEGTDGESRSPGFLQLIVEPNDVSIVENADNITVSPWGDLIVCEDGPEKQHLLRITPRGDVSLLARNAVSESEFAGACFSPDGSTLFVNIQKDGLTLAITGPWPKSE